MGDQEVAIFIDTYWLALAKLFLEVDLWWSRDNFIHGDVQIGRSHDMLWIVDLRNAEGRYM